jgi:hypothetical protein
MADNGDIESREVRYLVLADRAVPYLLARVRWPDVAQALSAASGDWLHDPGLFDLPYDPNAVTVTFPQAASIAAGWGRRLAPEPSGEVASYLRRMPADWSNLSPSERHTWGIESIGRRRTPGRSIRRPLALRAAVPARRDPSERRVHPRVELAGRAHIQSADTTISVGLVDLGERGLQCLVPGVSELVARGKALTGGFVLEAEADASRICLDVAGRIRWQRRTSAGTQFGVAFGELTGGETEGVRMLLAAGNRRRRRP